MGTLEWGDRKEVIDSAKRNIMYLSAFMRRDITDYKIDFAREIRCVEDGTSYSILVNFDNKRIKMSESEYRYLAAYRRGKGDKFPELAMEYTMDKWLARGHLGKVLDISASDAYAAVVRKPHTIDMDYYSVRITENTAIADAALKIISIMSLYDGSKSRGWGGFAAKSLGQLLECDINWLAFEEEEKELKRTDVKWQTRRALDEWKRNGNFHGFTLRFLDSIENRTRDRPTQLELLSDIFTNAFLQAYPKREQLEGMIFNFFDEQYVKQKALGLAASLRKLKTVPKMHAEKPEQDLMLDQIKSAARKSVAYPKRPGIDPAKEAAEN